MVVPEWLFLLARDVDGVRQTTTKFLRPLWLARRCLPGTYFSEATERRSRWGSVRGNPVLSSHFSPGFAPQVGQRTAKACFCFVFMAT